MSIHVLSRNVSFVRYSKYVTCCTIRQCGQSQAHKTQSPKDDRNHSSKFRPPSPTTCTIPRIALMDVRTNANHEHCAYMSLGIQASSSVPFCHSPKQNTMRLWWIRTTAGPERGAAWYIVLCNVDATVVTQLSSSKSTLQPDFPMSQFFIFHLGFDGGT